MTKYPVEHLRELERTPRSPLALSNDLWDVLSNSLSAKVTLEACNRDTGEYRVVLQGTLEQSPEPRGEVT
jgi:hypothetical protein